MKDQTLKKDNRVIRVKSLIYSVWDGFFYSVMVGCGETYFSAFALLLGATTFQMGVLTTVPPFLAGLSQIFTLPLMKSLPSRKKLVCIGVVGQIFSFLPMGIAYLYKPLGFEIYLLLVSVYFCTGAVIGPVWNSWMGDLVQVKGRGLYFGRRNRLITLGTFLSMTAAGFSLRYFQSSNHAVMGFLIIFLIASFARGTSLYFLSLKYDPPAPVHRSLFQTHGIWHFVKTLPSKNYGPLILYLSLVNLGIFVSAAYFTPILIRHLKFDYLTYTLIVSGAALSRFLTSGSWGKLIDRFGARKMILVSGLLATFSPIFWIWLKNPYLFFVAQLYTGLVFAGYELSYFTLLLDSTEPEERAAVSSFLSIIMATAGFIGGLIGVALTLPWFEDYFGRQGFWSQFNPFAHVIILSCLIRVVAFFSFGIKTREMRLLRNTETAAVLTKPTGFKSSVGMNTKWIVFTPRKKDSHPG